MKYSLTRATLWNLSGYLYLIIASFFSIPIIISSLGITTFSQYVIILAILTLASSIDLGLSSAVIRKLARDDHDHHHTIWSTSLTLFLSIGLVVALITTFIIYQFGITISILPIIFIYALTNHLLSHFLTLPQALGRFDLYNLRTFLVGTANTLIAASLAHLGYGINSIIIAQIIAMIITIIILIRYSYNHFHHFIIKPSIKYSRELLSFGIKNQIGKIMGQLGAQYAKFLLAPISALAVSSYSISQGVVLKLAGSLTQLSTALYPVSSASTHSIRLRRLYHRAQLIILVSSLLGITIYSFFGLPFLTWWLTDLELVTAVHSVLNFLIPYLAILTLTPLASTILDSHNKPGTTSFFATITILLEIILAVYLLPTYGLLSPAISALISVSLTTPFLLIVTERTLHSVK